MRTLKKYQHDDDDDFDLLKQIDLTRDTAVLIRQSDHRANEDHAFSRESQLKLVAYAQRLRNDATDEHVRVYDEGTGVSGQKRIDERVELNRLYNDIKQGRIGSLVVIHEDRLFRDAYHTNDTTFIQLLAECDVLLFVRTDNRRYDCTKPSDRNALLDKMIASRNYLDDHLLSRMAGNQRVKALQGLFDGRSLAMGYVTQGKQKQQRLYIYEPWAEVVRWLFTRFKELDNFSQLCREVENMEYLFPDPSADDLLRYRFKIHMHKVPGGFMPKAEESLKYILTNPIYIGSWVYNDAIVIEDNHPAIVDRDLFLWSYHKLTGRDLQGQWLKGVNPRSLRPNTADAVLKYILRAPEGLFYVMRPEHPEYIWQTFRTVAFQGRKLRRDVAFAMRAKLIDDIFLDRLKELARGDVNLAQHVESSLAELRQEHTEAIVSVEEHLTQVRMEQEKTIAFLHNQILDLTPHEKAKYNKILQGLREREQELLAVKEQSAEATLQADLEELRDILADIPTHLDTCSMKQKQKLARLLTESVMLEEVSVHWLRLTVVWRGPLANRPDVCLIWRQRGRRNQPWTAEEDAAVKEHYPNSDKWTALRALPRRNWNVIGLRATQLGVRRTPYLYEKMPETFAIDDLAIFPDQDFAFQLICELSDPHSEGKQNVYPLWLYSARTSDLVQEITGRNMNPEDWAMPR